MRIDNTYLTNLKVAKNPSPAEATRHAEGKPKPLDDNSKHIPSPELLKYIGLLQQETQVRKNLVKLVALRLKRGDYLTPEAAQKTAEAILQSRE